MRITHAPGSSNLHIRKTPLPLAVALALGVALPAIGQTPPYYAWTGSVNPTPADPNIATFTLGVGLNVGNGAPGSFSALAGATLTADHIAIGNGGTGSGTMTIAGPSTQVNLTTATDTRIDVGAWGTGTLSVSGGAIVDAASAACTSGCGVFVGNGAGTTATLNVSGAGSEVRTRAITVGQSSVFINPPSAITFGTPGGTTNAFVNVQSGGKLTTERATVGSNNGSPNGNGSEKAFGTVVIDGANSQWLVKNNSLGAVGNQAAGLTIGINAGGEGTVNVTNGGKLRIDGTGGPGPNDFLNIAVNGGKGALTVSGAGSSVDIVGVNTVLQVGRSGASAQGSFNVLAGATASALYVNVGRDSASGTMLIDGVGSVLTQSGVGTNQSAGVNGPAFTTIARNGATGTVTVSNGGQWLISDGGGDGRTAVGSPGMFVGAGGANATGSLAITGAGSKVEITSSSMNPGAGIGDNYNAYMVVGREANSTGTLNISNGGKLVMTGNALATSANRRNTQLLIGGYSDSTLGGTGTATVTGPGSELRVQGVDGFVVVGHNGTGTLNLTNQALFATTRLNVGRAAGGDGTLVVDNSFMELSGQFTGDTTNAGFSVGNLGGTGTATIKNNSVVTITNMGSNGANLSLGGTGLSPLGHGELTLSSGSKINLIAAPGQASMNVGYDGSGVLTITGNGSQIDLGDGTAHLGRLTTGSGTVSLLNGGKLLTGVTNIGGSSDTVAGGTASVLVSGAGSELRASGSTGFIGVGRGGTGTLTVENGGTASAIAISVGRNGGNGTLTVDNATLNLSGQQTAGNLVGANLAIGLGSAAGGLGAGTGVADIKNGSTVNITNYTAVGNVGANLVIGGSSLYPQGNGTLNLSGGSQINVLAAAGVGQPTTLGNVTIGNNGSGTATLSGASTIDVGAGNVYVGRAPGGIGVLNLLSGSKLKGGDINFGGNSDAAAGGSATVTVSGAGSEIAASGDLARVLVGRGGTGTLNVDSGGTITAKNLTIGRAAGGNGTLNADNATINLSGEQTGGFGAALSVGNRGGTGTATINHSAVTITNGTAAGAALNVGGTAPNPLGTGVLNLTGGTTVNVNAAAGLGTFNVGYDGNGTANLSGPGTTVSVNNGGAVYVARQAGSTGVLNLSNGATINAGFVGVGVGSAGLTRDTLGTPGGTATLVLNDSTINTSRFELGANGLLTGNNGTINAGANGPVVIAGTISPGNSPGRLRILCDVTMLPGSKLILEINDRDGGPGVDFDIDQLIIGEDAKFDLSSLQIIFSFIGNTNPNEFAATPGGFNLDKFLLAGGPDNSILGGLSTLFGNERNPDVKNWEQAVNPTLFAFQSSAFDVTNWSLSPDGEVQFDAAAVPEPATYALVLLALALMLRGQRRGIVRR